MCQLACIKNQKEKKKQHTVFPTFIHYIIDHYYYNKIPVVDYLVNLFRDGE